MRKKILRTTLALAVLLSSSLLTGNVSKVKATDPVVTRAWAWGFCSTPGSSCEKTRMSGVIIKLRLE
jgi:hypothetical protein